MSLTSKEAAETLSDVEQTARKSAQAFGYSKASPHLVLWGAIWFVGYAATDLFPTQANWIWFPLIFLGIAIGIYLGRSGAIASADAGPAARAVQRKLRTRRSWQSAGLGLIIFVFISATYAVMWPVQGMQFAAFPALLVGAIYAASGMLAGLRYVVTGLAISALTLIGYFYLQEHFLLWMAFVGGGGLVLAGLWFRTA